MRYLIKFSKKNDIKFISHLDLMKTIQRTIKRSGLPVEYSKGFNPHMSMSIAQPLSVGMYSEGEYMDVNFKEDMQEEIIKDRLNEKVPRGIRILEVIKVYNKTDDKKIPQSMAVIEAAEYKIKIKYLHIENLKQELQDLEKTDEWNIIKKGKKGEKQVNIKPLLINFNTTVDSNVLYIDTLVQCGSKSNLSAQLLSKFIQNNTTGADEEAFVDIERIEMYTYVKEKMIPLYKMMD